MKKILLFAVITTAMLTSCSAGRAETESQSDELIEPVITDTQTQFDYSALSTESNGYGQVVLLDDRNRPTGALDFNSSYGKYNATAINEEKSKITLTFDQGYENGYTSQILDTLKEKNVKATFFLLQDYAEKNPELVQRMIDEGHTVGNHSVSHYSMPELTAEECREEIMGLHQYMEDNFGYEMTLFRPPMGEFSELSLAVTADCGYETVLWSYAYTDWDTENQPDPDEALEKLTGAVHDGAIYLLHSVSQTNAEILGDFIDEVRNQGFEFE